MIDEYGYLWDGSSEGWVLLQVSSGQGESSSGSVIYNVNQQRALLISDDEVYLTVKRRMMDAGVALIDKIT
ncbi:MAG TPA: hypothetical protein DEA38_15565 [Stenotrophomonas sp.]|jgi:hypothetical protein|nr:hypothetical protein [Stenotrophomonas sp.]